MTNEWRKYPEAMYAHLVAGELLDNYTGDPIVDETACGLRLDRRNNACVSCEPDSQRENLCDDCYHIFISDQDG